MPADGHNQRTVSRMCTDESTQAKANERMRVLNASCQYSEWKQSGSTYSGDMACRFMGFSSHSHAEIRFDGNTAMHSVITSESGSGSTRIVSACQTDLARGDVLIVSSDNPRLQGMKTNVNGGASGAVKGALRGIFKGGN